MRCAPDIASKVLLYTLFYPLYYLCCCCCCCNLHRGGCVRRPSPGWFEVHKESPPKQLPARRQRALTLPLPPKSLNVFGTVQKTNGQDQSHLLTKLPWEIRLQIYELTLSGDGFPMHLVRRVPTHISHIRCCRRDANCYRYDCFRSFDSEPGVKIIKYNRTHGGLLPLLLSCRRVYTEAINIIYNSNVFEFKDLDTLNFFPTTVLPQRLDAIRSMRLQLDHGFEPAWSDHGSYEAPLRWKVACYSFSRMEGLQSLLVDLGLRGNMEAREVEMMVPLAWIKQVKKFVVNIMWSMGSFPDPDLPYELYHIDRETHKLVPRTRAIESQVR